MIVFKFSFFISGINSVLGSILNGFRAFIGGTYIKGVGKNKDKNDYDSGSQNSNKSHLLRIPYLVTLSFKFHAICGNICHMNGYIFRCSESTYYECLKRMLFGQTRFYKNIISKIKKGDHLFLYNATTHRLHGEFVAVSDGQENIEEDAWKGKFPWQVKVKFVEEFKPIRRDDFNELLIFERGLPEIPVNEEQINSLRQIFRNAQDLLSNEVELLDKYQKTYKTNDGHMVASEGELLIDNWLFDHRVWHIYEPKLLVEENVLADFGILTKDENIIYLEFWGMDGKRYKERKESKTKIYKDNLLILIEIFPEDLRSLNEVFQRKLKPYLG